MFTLEDCRAFYAQEIRFAATVAIFSGGSLRDPAFEPLIKNALATGGLLKLNSVRRDAHEPTDTCVLHAAEVCLSTAPLSSSAIS
ncbi:MAG: hypothetical protein WA192_12455 [Candidatus Acidiferrales bacterium]